MEEKVVILSIARAYCKYEDKHSGNVPTVRYLICKEVHLMALKTQTKNKNTVLEKYHFSN